MSREDRDRLAIALTKPLEGANLNGRIYPPGLREKALAEYQERIQRGEVFGSLSDADPADPRAFQLLDFRETPEGHFQVEIETLPTPSGERLLELLRGDKANFTMGCRGTLADDGTLTVDSIDMLQALDPLKP